MKGWREVGLWVTVAAIAIGGVATYIRFETRTDAFIEAADRQHDRANDELEDLRRVEVKELAEENDAQAVELIRHQGMFNELKLVIVHQQEQIDELRRARE